MRFSILQLRDVPSVATSGYKTNPLLEPKTRPRTKKWTLTQQLDHYFATITCTYNAFYQSQLLTYCMYEAHHHLLTAVEK